MDKRNLHTVTLMDSKKFWKTQVFSFGLGFVTILYTISQLILRAQLITSPFNQGTDVFSVVYSNRSYEIDFNSLDFCEDPSSCGSLICETFLRPDNEFVGLAFHSFISDMSYCNGTSAWQNTIDEYTVFVSSYYFLIFGILGWFLSIVITILYFKNCNVQNHNTYTSKVDSFIKVDSQLRLLIAVISLKMLIPLSLLLLLVFRFQHFQSSGDNLNTSREVVDLLLNISFLFAFVADSFWGSFIVPKNCRPLVFIFCTNTTMLKRKIYSQSKSSKFPKICFADEDNDEFFLLIPNEVLQSIIAFAQPECKLVNKRWRSASLEVAEQEIRKAKSILVANAKDLELKRSLSETAARRGSVFGIYYLAVCCLDYVKYEDYYKPNYGVILLTRAASLGLESASARLGTIYKLGEHDVILSKEEATKYFKLAPNDSGALYNLANFHISNKNYADSIPLLIKSAEKGNSKANWRLGMIYEGKDNQIDYQKAVECYTQSAKKSYEPAQYSLALCYLYGRGTSIDVINAIYWFEKASERYYLANYYLGFIYFQQKQYNKAVSYFNKCSEHSSEAQNMLGVCNYFGTGVVLDYATAVSWFESAANKSNDNAKLNLAMCYYLGVGTNQDINKSVASLERISIARYPIADYLLGCFYETRGNLDDAFKAFYRAANSLIITKSVYRSALKLSHYYSIGIGVDVDEIEANKFTQRATDINNQLECNQVKQDDALIFNEDLFFE